MLMSLVEWFLRRADEVLFISDLSLANAMYTVPARLTGLHRKPPSVFEGETPIPLLTIRCAKLSLRGK